MNAIPKEENRNDGGSNDPSPPQHIPTAQLAGHDGPIHAIRFTADGKYCLTAGQDRTIRLWNPTKIDPAYNTSPPTTISSSSSPPPPIPHALPIQTYKNGSYTHPIHTLSINDSSTTILSSSSKSLILTDAITSQIKSKYHNAHNNNNNNNTASGSINTTCFSSKGECFLSGGYDGTVKIWDGRSFQKEPIQVLRDATDSITTVMTVQSPENMEGVVSEIVTTSVDGYIRTYDLRKGQLRTDAASSSSGKDPIVGSCITSNGECILASLLNGSIQLLDRNTGQLLKSYSGGHAAGNYKLECSVSWNDLYVVSGSEDGCVVFYDLVSGEVLQKLESDGGGGGDSCRRPTCSVVCYPNRKNWESMVLSASYDGGAMVWCNEADHARWRQLNNL